MSKVKEMLDELLRKKPRPEVRVGRPGIEEKKDRDDDEKPSDFVGSAHRPRTDDREYDTLVDLEEANMLTEAQAKRLAKLRAQKEAEKSNQG